MYAKAARPRQLGYDVRSTAEVVSPARHAELRSAISAAPVRSPITTASNMPEMRRGGAVNAKGRCAPIRRQIPLLGEI
ncbi:unnamed protein product, partial [Iphiclides podalirius]